MNCRSQIHILTGNHKHITTFVILGLFLFLPPVEYFAPLVEFVEAATSVLTVYTSVVKEPDSLLWEKFRAINKISWDAILTKNTETIVTNKKLKN